MEQREFSVEKSLERFVERCDFHGTMLRFSERLAKRPSMPRDVRGIMAGSFKPLTKYPIAMVVASIIIAAVLYLYTGLNTGLAEVVRQNSYPIHMLSTELLIELGPDYVDESERYVAMIEQYTRHMERRDYAVLLRLLRPRYSPEKVLASTRKALENAVTEEEAKNAIRQAGLISNQLYMLGNGFPRSPIAWFESEVVSDRLLSDLDNAFDEFHEQVDKLEDAQTQKDAEDRCRAACRVSRKALLLLFLARLGYDNEEKKIERFLSDIEQALICTEGFAEKYKSNWELFSKRVESMEFRADVVRAMLDNDMDKVCTLLSEKTKGVIER